MKQKLVAIYARISGLLVRRALTLPKPKPNVLPKIV